MLNDSCVKTEFGNICKGDSIEYTDMATSRIYRCRVCNFISPSSFVGVNSKTRRIVVCRIVGTKDKGFVFGKRIIGTDRADLLKIQKI